MKKKGMGKLCKIGLVVLACAFVTGCGSESSTDKSKDKTASETKTQSDKEDNKESGKESGTEFNKKSDKESGQETSKETDKEVNKEVTKESGRETSKEDNKEGNKESGKDALRDDNNETTTKQEAIYTDKDIYIKSFECGYLSQEERLPWGIILIETEEQISYAEQHYGLRRPKEESVYFNIFISDMFQEMKQEYPIDTYSYVLCYAQVSSGGYYLHADKLQIKDDTISFVMDDESYTPDEGDIVSEVMGGFFHMAAVPKEYLGNQTYSVIYPGVTSE